MNLFDKLPKDRKNIGDSGYILARQIGSRIFEVTDLSWEKSQDLALTMVGSVKWEEFEPNKRGIEIRLVSAFFNIAKKLGA